ncbi:MAG: ATP-binding cassette domain-containing protein [Roseburia sp.]|nr:ATP-binding cassette domain-containing protein [Roseburia sp.]
MEEKDYILKVRNLKQYFPIETNFFGKATKFVHAVDGVSFKLERGKTIGVVGESGCGKTTLGRTILKLYKKTDGDIYFENKDLSLVKGKELRKLRCDLQLIFQDPYSSLSPKMTVGEIISEAVRAHHIVPKEEVREYTYQVMEKCGLQRHYYERYPHEFSGGQRQRICIARALAVKPKLVICDEPVSALDVSIQSQIINLLKKLQKEENLTYIFISHDLSVVKYISDTIAVMYLGSLVELGSKKDIFKNPLHPYTQALFSAVPIPDPSIKMNRIILEGDLPSPANPPKGCKFHTRCNKCMDICKYEIPKLIELEENHFVACHLYQEEAYEETKEKDNI